MLVVQWITEVAVFAELSGEWDRLVPVDSTPFDLHCWYQTWFEAFGADLGLAICTAWRDGRLVAVFPLAWEGKSLRPLANSHSARFRPLASDPEAMQAVVDEVIACGAKQVGIPIVPCGDPCLGAILDSTRRRSVVTLREPGYPSPVVVTDGCCEDWRRLEHKKWKAGINRHRNKMSRDHECEFRIAQRPDDLWVEFEQGLALEAASWKGDAGTAISSNPCTLAFYRGIAAAFQDRDELRFSTIALEGEAVAFCFGIEHCRRLYALKIAYDEAHRKLSPGLVLQIAMVERAFETDIDAYEMLGDPTYWKQKLANSMVERTDLRLYPRNPGGIARFAYRRKVRPVLKATYHRLGSQKRFDRSLPR